jgi:apolipoprotein N-acyltransferase
MSRRLLRLTGWVVTVAIYVFCVLLGMSVLLVDARAALAPYLGAAFVTIAVGMAVGILHYLANPNYPRSAKSSRNLGAWKIAEYLRSLP